jgi:CTP:molybdopterin cytidylyltransferase MocA
MSPALVILAAGASARLGQCKALADLGGRTPLLRLLEAGGALAADAAPALVVAGPDHDAIARAVPRGVEVLCNAHWAAGRTRSAALAARARPGRDLCLAPVDVPLVPRAAFEALIAAWQAHGGPRVWAQAAHQGRAGHPVVLGADLARELAARLDEGLAQAGNDARNETRATAVAAGFDWKDFPLRALRARAALVLDVECGSPRVLDDLDTPLDLERLRGLVS